MARDGKGNLFQKQDQESICMFLKGELKKGKTVRIKGKNVEQTRRCPWQ